MSRKRKMSQFRNITYGRLIAIQNSIQNILLNLPNDDPGMVVKERDTLLEVKRNLTYILSTWKGYTNFLINEIKEE